MNNHESPEITKARDLLSKSEKGQDHKIRISYIEQAIEILEQYTEDDSNSPEGRLLAQTILRTHSRKLLSDLPLLKNLDAKEWALYVALMGKLRSADALCVENPTLYANYHCFLMSRDSEISDVLKEHLYRAFPEESEDERMRIIALISLGKRNQQI
jgi:hypothetical protein